MTTGTVCADCGQVTFTGTGPGVSPALAAAYKAAAHTNHTRATGHTAFVTAI